MKRILAFLLVIVLLTLTLPVFAEDADMRYGRKKLGEMPNGAALVYAYDKLVSGCASLTPPTIDLSHSTHKVSITEFRDHVFPMFYSDYPEYFWVMNGGYRYSYRSDNTVTAIQPSYAPGISNLSAAKTAFESKVSALLSGISGSDYDKAKVLHDRLIDAVTYTSSTNDQNTYGALVEGKAVCNGYARAYQHLLQKAGIPAWYVRGSSINPNTGNPEEHAWNLVKLDGQWYYTDVTWDDQKNDTFYAYFNITTAQLLADHTLDSNLVALVPQATATAANLYVKENRVFTGYDQGKLVDLLKKDNKKTQIYVSGDGNAFLSSLDNNLLSVGTQLGGTGAFRISYTVTQLGKAMLFNVVLLDENHVHRAKTTVPQVNATCLTNGTKAHYICDCGFQFLDSACTQQVTDNAQLMIAAENHSPSGWQNDATGHWKVCTKCGSETADTRAGHGDSNTDYKCDTCGYALPVPNQGGDASGGTQTPVSTQPAPDATSPAEAPTSGAPTEGTTPAGSDMATDSATPNDGAGMPGGQTGENKNPAGTWIIVVGCIVLIAGGVTAGILWKKKMTPAEAETPEEEPEITAEEE